MEEVRPKVLPKLREENENAKRKGGKKKKGIKDVASQEDFEVTIFLTETSTRHSLLTKQKQFSDKSKLTSTSNKLTGWLNDDNGNRIVIDDDEEPPRVLREEDDEVVELRDIPEADANGKRKASGAAEDGDDALFVSSSDEEFFQTQRVRGQKRTKRGPRQSKSSDPPPEVEVAAADDKKKLALNTSYDGFSIYGRILCLVVKRKGKKAAESNSSAFGRSQMIEQWVSTQAAQEAGLDEDEDR